MPKEDEQAFTDPFSDDAPPIERKVRIHKAGEDSTCTSCEG